MNPDPKNGATEPLVSVAALRLLRCPKTGKPLRLVERDGIQHLATPEGECVYEIREGIPVLIAPELAGSAQGR